MKTLFLVLVMSLPFVFAQAQVGINTITPKVTLDVRGENDTNSNPGALATTDGVLVPRVTDLAVNGVKEGQLVYLIENAGAFTKGFHYWDGAWKPIINNAVAGGELEKLTEAGQTGYRLKGAVGLNYGNIGADAMDLSISTSFSNTRGATGTEAFAAGSQTTASGNYSTALGQQTKAESFGQTSLGIYNTSHGGSPNAGLPVGSDRLLVVGNGVSGANSDALLIFKNGLITAPSLSPFMITDGDAKTLTTKEWVNTNSETGVLQKITENGSTGYRKKGISPDHYGDIGPNAIDLSHSFLQSTTFGATGGTAFASGLFTTASGNYSTAMGHSVTAESYGQTSMGIFGTPWSSGDPDNIQPTNRLFQIGNGTSNNDRSDALLILKNGLVVAPSLTNALIDQSVGISLTTKAWVLENDDKGELEKITEGGNTGYRVKGRNPAHYSNIGEQAVDFSLPFVFMGSSSGGATGENSLATGLNTRSSGTNSVATGSFTIASGEASFTTGNDTRASGDFSFAAGQSSTASGDGAVAMGDNCYATGERAVALGGLAIAEGENSIAIGLSTATGDYAVAMGRAEAAGDYTTALGRNTIAESYGQTTLGVFSTIEAGDANNYVIGDRLFVIGNGTAQDERSDVMTIYKGGGTVFSSNVFAPTFNPTSDRRLKTNIEPLTAGMSTLNKIDTYQYNFKKGDTERLHYGVIAQELQEVLPNLVNQQQSGEKMLGVNYTELIPIMINALKEQQAINEELRNASNDQQAQIASLNDRYNEILNMLGKSTSGKK